MYAPQVVAELSRLYALEMDAAQAYSAAVAAVAPGLVHDELTLFWLEHQRHAIELHQAILELGHKPPLVPQDSQFDSVTKFTWAGRLGLRVKTSDRISLRVHAQITNPVQAFGGGLYLGTGGAGAGATTYSTIWQFNMGGSLII
jgi:hypothetical protein